MDCPFVFATASCLLAARVDDAGGLWVGLLLGLVVVIVAGVLNYRFHRSLETLRPEEREEALKRWREPLF